MVTSIKVIAWVLAAFSTLAIIGILSDPTAEGASYGVLYAGAVLVQSVLVLVHVKNQQ